MTINCGVILVIDDDPLYVEFVSAILERVGFRTAREFSGENALAAVAREMPACVLLDVHLPGVNGYAVCRELREEYGQELPIIFVSGDRTEPPDRVAGLLLGADDYIIKPFDPDELVARVRRAVTRAESWGRRANVVRLGLTTREREVLGLLAAGLSQKTIARRLFITPKTAATHIQRVLGKLGAHSRAEAVAIAHREGLTRDTSQNGETS